MDYIRQGEAGIKRWQESLSTSSDLKKSAVNQSVFYIRTKDEHTIIVVATDNMAITSKQLQDVEKLKNELCQHWKISNLGELTWYLGFWVCRD